MHRVAIIVASCVALLGSAAALAYRTWGEEADAEGRRLHQHRVIMELSLAEEVHTRTVAFLGDSTMMDKSNWAGLVGRGLRRHRVTPVKAIYPGQDLFHHYCVSGKVLEWTPDVAIILVNARAMSPGRRVGASVNLCSFLPPSQLVRSLDLPFYDRGVSLVRLWLTQALRYAPVLDAFFAYEGARRMIADSRFSNAGLLGGTKARPRTPRGWRDAYAKPLWPSHPLVRMLGALVSEFRGHGVHPMVVVSPVPPKWLDSIRREDPDHWRRNHDVLERAVEKAGGELIDLHDFLTESSFRDDGGHLNRDGHARVFNRVAFRLHKILGIPPPVAPVFRPEPTPTETTPTF